MTILINHHTLNCTTLKQARAAQELELQHMNDDDEDAGDGIGAIATAASVRKINRILTLSLFQRTAAMVALVA